MKGLLGMTSDHLFPVLEREGDSQSLAQVGSCLAVGNVPDEIIGWDASQLSANRMEGVRGTVVGNILRRMVARTMAKQVAKKVEAATSPFQSALSSKAGCECVAHMTLTQRPPSSPLMASAHATTSPGTPCWRACCAWRTATSLPFRPLFLWKSFNLFMGGRNGSHPRNSPRRGWGAG